MADLEINDFQQTNTYNINRFEIEQQQCLNLKGFSKQQIPVELLLFNANDDSTPEK